MSRWNARLRRATVRGAIAIALLCVATLLWYRNAYILPPEPSVSVRLPQPNGYETIRDASKLLVRKVDGVSSYPINKDEPWPLAGRKKLLTANAAALNQMREALHQDFLMPPVTNPAVIKNPPYREFARLLACAATSHAEEGNLPLAAQDAVDAIVLGDRVPQGGGLVDLMVGIACTDIGGKALWNIADQLDSKTAQATALRLEGMEARRWPFANSLREEQRINHLSIRLLFEGGPIPSWNRLGTMVGQADTMVGWFSQAVGLPEPPPPSLGERMAAWANLSWMKTKTVYAGPRRTLENMDRYLETLRVQSELPWSNPRPVVPLPEDTLSQIILPMFGQAEFKVVQNRTSRALVTTYLALRAYRLHQGTYPASLESLTSEGYLKSLPIDAFSPTGSALGYRRNAEDRMTLWSVGPDAKDEGGRPIVDLNSQGKQRRGFFSLEATGDIVARINTW